MKTARKDKKKDDKQKWREGGYRVQEHVLGVVKLARTAAGDRREEQESWPGLWVEAAWPCPLRLPRFSL